MKRHARHPLSKRAEAARSHPVAIAVAKQAMAEHMTTIGISIYLMADGEPTRDLLSHLGWVIGIGAEIAAIKTPGSAQAKRLHAALRTAIAMSETAQVRMVGNSVSPLPMSLIVGLNDRENAVENERLAA